MRLQDLKPLPIYYFAYGMLTNPKNMQGAEAVGAARLPNHKFEFYQFADVVAEPGSQVHGVLWKIPREMLAELDQVEGVPWLYNRKMVPVICDGERYEAYIYTMTPASRETVKNRIPSKSYVKSLGRGYARFGLPADQINRAYADSRGVAEVAMNPAAYADSMTAAAEKGVLIGFEFEVYVPKATIEQIQRPERPGIEYFWKVVIEDEDGELDLQLFNQLFQQKRPFRYNGRTYSSMQDLIDREREKDINTVRQIFDRLPEPIRNRILDRWRRRRASREASEDEFITWLSDQMSRMLTDTSTWRNLVGLRLYDDVWNDLYRIRNKTRASTSADIINNFLADTTLQKFQNVFDHDDAVLKQRYRERAEQLEDEDDNFDDGNFLKAAQVLKPEVESVMGASVQVFHSYHQQKKNMTDWYIEPDGSLEDPHDYLDAGAEIVSPPLPVNKAMDALRKFYGMARGMNLYTNESTGLHINVSIPDQLDVLKLAMFLGDEHVLQVFNREDSSYARSVMRNLRGEADPAMVRKRRGRTELDLKILQKLAKESTDDHFASISHNGKYISFRHAGGNYLQNPQTITDLVGRFVRAMVIAADPNLYRQEYLKKMTKVIGIGLPLPVETQSLVSLINDLKKNGVPVLTVDVRADEPWDVAEEIVRDLGFNHWREDVKKIRATQAEIKQSLGITSVSRDQGYLRYERFLYIPRDLENAKRALPVVDRSGKINQYGEYYPYRVKSSRIPITDPRASRVLADIKHILGTTKK